MISIRNDNLAEKLKELYYEKAADLLFHGWHHIHLTARKAPEFAEEFPDVDKELVEAAALVHDLNFIAAPKSEPEAGAGLRTQYLSDAGFSTEEISYIESVVIEAHTATRHADISNAAKALSDADSLFKVMPLTPIIFSSHWIVENKADINEWADKIIKEQSPLMEQGIYFYTKMANEKYLEWAKLDLELVKQVKQSLEDPAIKETLEIAYDLKVI